MRRFLVCAVLLFFRRRGEKRRGEKRFRAGDFRFAKPRRARIAPHRVHFFAERVYAEIVHQNLDARAVFVVAPTVEIVDAQNRLQIRRQVRAVQRFPNDFSDDRRAPHAAADQHAKMRSPGRIVMQAQSDVVPPHRRAVGARAADRDLKFARQPVKFRVQRRPLANQLAPRARVFNFVSGRAGQMVGGDVAHAVSAGLNRMHANFGEARQNLRHIREFRPVELDVLARGKVAETSVKVARDFGEFAELRAAQHAVGNRHAQHVGVALLVESVAQPQVLKVLGVKRAVLKARHLPAELAGALGEQFAVVFAVLIHLRTGGDWGESTGG